MQINQISVVVPVRNEEGNVALLIGEIDSALKHISHEIVYVDDGSTDDTYSQLTALQTQFTQLKIVRHAHSCGQSTAVRTGVKAAQYAWVTTLDGDGQNDPADIPKLITAVVDGVGLVGGNRRASRRDTWVKRMSSVVANTVRSKMLRDDTPDTGCGLKLFKGEAFLDLPYFDHMHRFYLRSLSAVAAKSSLCLWRIAIANTVNLTTARLIGCLWALSIFWLGLVATAYQDTTDSLGDSSADCRRQG